jgi:muconolactone delta-isomerase
MHIRSSPTMQTTFWLIHWISHIFALHSRCKQYFDWFIEFRTYSLFTHDVNNILTDLLNFVYIRSFHTMQTTFWLIYWISCIFALQPQCKQLLAQILNLRYIHLSITILTRFWLIYWISFIFALHERCKQHFDWFIKFRSYSLFIHDVNNILTDLLNFMHVPSSTTM